MSELFGLDIESLVSEALQGQLTSLTLTRTVVSNYDSGTDSQTSTPETFTSEGIAPAISSIAGRFEALGEQLVKENEVPILILAKPLGTDPQAGDKITIDGNTYTVTRVIERDPAGATWTVAGEL